MRLVYSKTGKPVRVGDEVTVSGVVSRIESCPPPHKPDSSGRVFLSNGANYYVSLIGAEWIDREDRRSV